MPIAEYRCRSCGAEYEYLFALDQYPYPSAFACTRCPETATRYFSRPPGMSPDPHWAGYFDRQLGCYITSRDEKRRILKEKGLEEISAKEHDRQMANVKEKEDVIPPDDPKLRDAMEKAWADTKAGNIPPVTLRKVDTDEMTVLS